MENNQILKVEDIRNNLENDIMLTMNNIFKKGGMYHYFRSMHTKLENAGCEINAEEVYQDTIHLLNKIEEILANYPNDYKTILSGEFKDCTYEGFPLFVWLDLAHSFCNHTKYILSEEEMERFQHIMSIARNVEFSNKFNKNWHISDTIYNNVGCDAFIHFGSCVKKQTYRDREGYHEFNSTIQTFNYLKYGCTEEENNSEEYLSPDEEYLNNYDFKNFPELECSEIYVARITNTSYAQGSWTARRFDRICPLFQEQIDELEKRYEILRKKIITYKREKRYSNFNVLFPYFAHSTLNEFVLSEHINWEENEYVKAMARNLDMIHYAFQGYYGNKEINFESIIKKDDFDNVLKKLPTTIDQAVSCERAAKQEIVKVLVEYYMQSSKFAKYIFRMKDFVKEELEQKLMQLSLEELSICREKVNTKFLGVQYIKPYIN